MGRSIHGRCVGALLLVAVAFHSQPVIANGFEDFEDAELIDHIAGSVARGYGRMHGYGVDFKLIGKETPHQSPLLVQYNAPLKRCTFFISTRDKTWHSFELYLEFFDGLPKQLVYEAFFAHESGHCVQMREQIDFGPVRRRHREELYADVFWKAYGLKYVGSCFRHRKCLTSPRCSH